MKLPQGLPQVQMENTWASMIEPILSKNQNNSLILKNISLVVGSNTINHRLGRKLEGWKTSRVRAAATIYDAQESNPTPQLTLVLVTDNDVTVDLEVF